MTPIEMIAYDLFEKIRSRFSNLQMGDENSAVTSVPQDARFFDFDFVAEEINLGRVSISINDIGNLKVFYSQGITEKSDNITRKNWYDFLREMRFFAKRRLLRFDTRDIAKGNLDKTDFQYLAQNGSKEKNMTSVKEGHKVLPNIDTERYTDLSHEGLEGPFRLESGKVVYYDPQEGKYYDRDTDMYMSLDDVDAHRKSNFSESSMYGSSKTSHRTIEDTDLIIRHSEAIDPSKPGARSRKIKNLFIQNKDGERFKFPFIYLPGARAMQRHVANGGHPHDDAGKKITKTCEEIMQLSNFGRKVRNSTLTDSANSIVERANQKLKSLRNHMESMCKQKYYETWMESSTEEGTSTELDEVTTETYRDAFTVNKFDESLLELFPLLHSIMKEADEIELSDYVHESQDGYVYTRYNTEIVSDLGDGYHLADDGYDDDEGFYKANFIVLKEIPGKSDQFKLVSSANVSPYSIGRKPGQLDAEIERIIAADKSKNQTQEIASFESWASSIVGEGFSQDQLNDLQELVKNPLPLGVNGEAVQALKGIGITDQSLLDAIEAIANMPNGADEDAREIIKTYMGNDADKIDWETSEPAQVTPTPEEPVGENDSIEHDDEHRLIEPGSDNKTKINKVAELVMGFYDRDNGTWTKGEHGVVTHVKRQFSDDNGNGGDQEAELAAKLISHLNQQHEESHHVAEMRRLAGLPVVEAKKPSEGLSKAKKSNIVKKAKSGGDIGKKGKSFDKVAKAAGGGEKGKKIAAAAMWKNIKR